MTKRILNVVTNVSHYEDHPSETRSSLSRWWDNPQGKQ